MAARDLTESKSLLQGWGYSSAGKMLAQHAKNPGFSAHTGRGEGNDTRPTNPTREMEAGTTEEQSPSQLPSPRLYETCL